MDKRERWDATSRNAEPILAVLKRALPSEGTVLEVASGTGQHAACFSEALSGLRWQPSDADIDHFESIEAWRADAAHEGFLPPVHLDVTAQTWPVTGAVEAIVNINMVHISPWNSCIGLFTGACRYLSDNGVLFLYGPYRVDGRFRSEGDRAFDASLKQRNPNWGIRDLEQVVAAAEGQSLKLVEMVEMPANNLSLIFHRAGKRV
ncbi:MAG: DUF938 domain-containing protein [Alphaproteobacteria bacterium]